MVDHDVKVNRQTEGFVIYNPELGYYIKCLAKEYYTHLPANAFVFQTFEDAIKAALKGEQVCRFQMNISVHGLEVKN